MSGCTNAVASRSESCANVYCESFANSAPFPESPGWKSIRSRPGIAAYSRHTECSVEPSGWVAVFRCTNVSVPYQ
ncbi:MAG: hypothetical protein DMD37_09315 [Gemmatimonadetes bacterium]|nr:MAG: hypothetical protein DMD37_09315 [Gemmatimonadota bacterium]